RRAPQIENAGRIRAARHDCSCMAAPTPGRMVLPKEPIMRKRVRSAASVVAGCAALSLSARSHARPGPDVLYADITDTVNHGAVGGIRAYSVGTATCTLGDQNLLWSSHNPPAVGFNVFRLQNGRMVQLGLSFCKTACCAAAG